MRVTFYCSVKFSSYPEPGGSDSVNIIGATLGTRHLCTLLMGTYAMQ